VESQTSCLETLAAEVSAHGWAAYLTTPLGRPVRLFVQNPADRVLCSYIMAAPDATTGEWWYWFGWAERIAPAATPAVAAQAIVRALQRPAHSALRACPHSASISRAGKVLATI
jgi:hypothetical protein